MLHAECNFMGNMVVACRLHGQLGQCRQLRLSCASDASLENPTNVSEDVAYCMAYSPFTPLIRIYVSFDAGLVRFRHFVQILLHEQQLAI